jgi:putative FmdB family regulatory protein
MPIYEYVCADCRTTFEILRPMSKANAPAPCAQCGGYHTSRGISLFAAVSRGSNGETRQVSGSGCGSCAGTHCSTCNH